MSIQSLLLHRVLPGSLLAGAALLVPAGVRANRLAADEVPLEIARVYFEYNRSVNDLGVHVFLDGEDWKKLKIVNPKKKKIFEVTGSGPYKKFGMTELFFEGAEPALTDVPVEELLDMFPAGPYEFSGKGRGRQAGGHGDTDSRDS
jgi:hypothetical protein